MKIVLGGIRIPSRRQRGVVVVFLHFRQGDGGHRGGRRARGAADGREPRAGPDGGHGQTARQASEKAVRGVEEPSAHPRVVRQLTHEDEQGDHGEIVGPEDGGEILRHQVQRRIPGHQERKPQQSHEGHDEAHGDLQEHERNQGDEPADAGFGGRHGWSPFRKSRSASTRSTSASRADPRAMQPTKGHVATPSVGDTSPLSISSAA